MSASRVRSRLRKARQQANRAFPTSNQKNEFPKAYEQFVIFGRPRPHGEGYRVTFEDFVERFRTKPDDTTGLVRYRRGVGAYIRQKLAEAKAKLKRRKESKKRRSQKLRA